MREPRFWWRQDSLGSRLLSPLGAVYGSVAGHRLTKAGARAGMPVVCVGNPTVGGAGKTPTAIAVSQMLRAEGERTVFLSRGYGGRLAGPVLVDPTRHRARDVGDEPLLLARTALTVVARDRVQGAQAAVKAGASVIVMDDGFQNPSLAKDFSILIVDSTRGVGNGRMLPAGPLRAPLVAQLERAQALVIVGAWTRAVDPIRDQASALHLPVFDARLVPETSFVTALGGGRVLAFAGIGDPGKFFTTLRDAGVAVAATRSFDDHHRYTRNDARSLCEQADRDGLVLVTTEKDLVRMQGDDEVAALAGQAHALPVALRFYHPEGFAKLMRETIERVRGAVRPEGD
jgi:tetraacyldisaccharide 4'-kinase